MRFISSHRRIATWAIVPLSIATCIIAAIFHLGPFVHADQTAAPAGQTIKLGTAQAGALYGFSLGLKDPAALQGNDAVHVTVNDAKERSNPNGCIRQTSTSI